MAVTLAELLVNLLYAVHNGTSSDFSQESFLSPSVAKDTGRKVCFEYAYSINAHTLSKTLC